VNSEVKKVLFIVNRYSGSGYQPAIGSAILKDCKKNNVECDVQFTNAPGHATELARNAIGRFDSIVAVGGDGTVNEVAQGLLYSQTPMGIIPAGSGNGLARHLGIPVKIGEALRCLFSGKTIFMDTFRINGMFSLNVSGIGFDGHIANLFGMDKTRGLQGYAKIAVAEFNRFREFDARISIGETVLERKAFVIAIANSSQYGNNAKIAPAASVCDELLHISILKKMPAFRLDFIYAFFAGTINQSAYCQIIEARDLTIELAEPMPFHIDGEGRGKSDRFTVEMVPASLRILAPCNILRP
jgi:YegS/Rv2252/BmrU family lipid kinase